MVNNMIFWVLTAYGFMTILVYGSIFNKLRSFLKFYLPFLGELVTCPLCSSTWIGFFMSIIFNHITDDYLTIAPELKQYSSYIYVFFDGLFTAGAVWVVNSIVEWFEENRIKFNN